MTDFEKLYSFNNLYNAYLKARRGKQTTKEVINFELNLAANLTSLSESIRNGSYVISDYYEFKVYDPKIRDIHALHYRDRVFQHCLCDEVIAPILDRKLIYDNAACRKEKGTHFALNRLTRFMTEFHRETIENRQKSLGEGAVGNALKKDGQDLEGFFLKCDIRKYFENIDHDILKSKLERVFHDTNVLRVLFMVIDSYESFPGKGLPLGNQSSQWFAIYYLDGFDRFVKEELGFRYYTRYMDDAVILCRDRERLKESLSKMREYIESECGLEFNKKTQIAPLKCGVDYLGFHFYLNETGKVVRKLRTTAKKRFKKKLKMIRCAYSKGKMCIESIDPIVASYAAHLSYGHNHALYNSVMKEFILRRTRARMLP